MDKNQIYKEIDIDQYWQGLKTMGHILTYSQISYRLLKNLIMVPFLIMIKFKSRITSLSQLVIS